MRLVVCSLLVMVNVGLGIVGLAEEVEDGTQNTATDKSGTSSEPIRVVPVVPQEVIDLVENGRFDEALPAYRRNVELEPNNADAHVILAGVLIKAGHHDEALKEIREAVRVGPTNARAHSFLGFVLMKSGNVQEGLGEFRVAVRLQPNNAKVRQELAVGLGMAGQVENAIKELEHALRLEPNYYQAYTSLADAYYNLAQYTKAIENYSASLAIKETQDARLGRAFAYRHNSQFKSAVEDCDRVLHDDPENHLAYACRAYANMCRRELDAAVRDAKRVLETGKEVADVAYLVRGGVSMARLDADSALQHLTKAIELAPEERRPLPYVLRALVRFSRGETDQVIPDLDAAIQGAGSPRKLNYYLDGFGWQVYKFRGMMYLYFTGPNSEAGAKDLTQAIAFNERLAVHENLMTAVKDLTQAIALNGSNADCYALRSQAFWELADWEHTLADLNKAVTIAPDHDLANFVLIRVLITCPDEEIRDGRRAVDLALKGCKRTNWKSPMYLGGLAAAYSEIGDFTSATEVQFKLVNMLPTQKQADSYPLGIWWNSTYTLYISVPEKRAAKLLELYQQQKPYRLRKPDSLGLPQRVATMRSASQDGGSKEKKK